jgi:hypothetical protein
MSATAYTRDDDGTLRPVSLLCMADEPGRLTIAGCPYRVTFDREEPLRGWGTDDGTAAVYLTESGSEIIVPERHTARVAKHLSI